MGSEYFERVTIMKMREEKREKIKTRMSIEAKKLIVNGEQPKEDRSDMFDNSKPLTLHQMIEHASKKEDKSFTHLSKIAGKPRKDEHYPAFKSPYIKPLDQKISQRISHQGRVSKFVTDKNILGHFSSSSEDSMSSSSHYSDQ